MRNPSTAADVLVVGGGPAGLAAAIAARLRGFDVLVADPALPPIDKACGEGLMPDGVVAARALGLDFAPVGQPFTGIRFLGAGDNPRTVEADFPRGLGIGLPRTVLHRMMVERAAGLGVEMAWGTPVTNLDGLRARWIIGADGGRSAVRRWAGLEASDRNTSRFGFRRHYRIAPWSERMEIHWGADCQLYITPVAAGEICTVVISRDASLRLDNALPQFPAVARRLATAAGSDPERGGVTASRRLKSVCRGNVALIGDASGSVDAITGEGLCLLFQQAVALAGALASGDLARYEREHRRIGRRPAFMGDLMLLLDGHRRLQTATLATLSAHPAIFTQLLALHVGKSIWSFA